MIPSAIKYHGGKAYLAKRLAALLPAHIHYVEPFAGSLAVLFARNPEGVSEVVNDINEDLMCFWRVLQGQQSFAAFTRLCQATPFSQVEWQDAGRDGASWPDDLDEGYSLLVVKAWKFFVRCRQSLAGRMDSFAPLSRRRTRRGMNEQASAWLSAIEGLPAVHNRLKRVVILNDPALEVIQSQDGTDVCFYIDPPYLPETRAAADVYHHEMSAAEHEELLGLLQRCNGKVMLSGYPSVLYDQTLAGWYRLDFDLPNHAAGGDNKRRMTESVYCNYPAPGGLPCPVIR